MNTKGRPPKPQANTVTKEAMKVSMSSELMELAFLGCR